MNIAIYARKSRLSEKGESIQNQINACKAYVDMQYPNSDITVFEDEGFSGGNIDRPQFIILQNQIKKRKFDILISYKLDRISRNINDFSNFVEMLDSHNCSYVSLKEQFDTSTPMGRAMMYILAVFAQLERETISERIVDNFTGLAATGRYLGAIPPEGYDKVKVEYNDKNGITKKYNALKINKDESKRVKFIFEKYLQWQSISKIQSYCMQNQITNRNGKYYKCITIRRLLTHPIYMTADSLAYEYLNNKGVKIAVPKEKFDGKHGISVLRRTKLTSNATYYTDYSEWVVAVGEHEPIISSEDWIKIQDIIESRKALTIRRPIGKKGLLSSLLRCKKCGSYMRPSSISGDRFYYCCEKKEKSRKTLCDSKNARGDKLDKEIIKSLKTMLFDENNQVTDFSFEKKQTNLLDYDLQKQLHQIEKKIKENDSIIKSLVHKLAVTENETLLSYITTEIENLDRDMKTLKLKKINIIEKINSCDTKFTNLNIALKAAEKIRSGAIDIEIKTPAQLLEVRNIIKDLIDRIEYDGEKAEIFMKKF